ncbi:hypothetical protein [Tateyamaria sp.]|uniref:hypothetical protein n=1 Tax=Tateyamaria sp. TaxID=1929288 RepID=UPI003B213F8E
MVNLTSEHKPIIQLGAGALFIDRYTDNGDVRGAERYIGDTTAASISATVERTTVYSGDGAVATKLVDRVRQIDRTMSITVQDATLDNFALFMMADRPEKVAALDSSMDISTVIRVPEHVTERHYFQLGAGSLGATPAGRPKFDLRERAIATTAILSRPIGSTTAFSTVVPTMRDEDYELDLKTARVRFTAAGIAKVKGREIEIVMNNPNIDGVPAFDRVSVGAEVKQIRVAVRYIEDSDPGMEGRNIYIPRATLSPAGEAALKSRDTPQQFPLQLAIEAPGGGLDQMYIDGVPE